MNPYRCLHIYAIGLWVDNIRTLINWVVRIGLYEVTRRTFVVVTILHYYVCMTNTAKNLSIITSRSELTDTVRLR